MNAKQSSAPPPADSAEFQTFLAEVIELIATDRVVGGHMERTSVKSSVWMEKPMAVERVIIELEIGPANV